MRRALAEAASREKLAICGTAPVTREDGLPSAIRSVILLGPQEPDFWSHFQASPEARDNLPDPLDRWSRRVIGRLACAHQAKAFFPFGPRPWHPFIAWSLRSGKAYQSPVSLLVHVESGLFHSVRGAIGVTIDFPADPAPSPCQSCPDKPCLSACPPRALTSGGYDTDACHSFLDTAAGRDCMTHGCAVRRACPVGRDRRLPAQSAFHMKAFHP